MVSRAAPPAVNATLMGAAMMTLFVSNTFVGWIGSWYESMGPAEFWALHAVIAAGGGLLIAVLPPAGERSVEAPAAGRLVER